MRNVGEVRFFEPRFLGHATQLPLGWNGKCASFLAKHSISKFYQYLQSKQGIPQRCIWSVDGIVKVLWCGNPKHRKACMHQQELGGFGRLLFYDSSSRFRSCATWGIPGSDSRRKELCKSRLDFVLRTFGLPKHRHVFFLTKDIKWFEYQSSGSYDLCGSWVIKLRLVFCAARSICIEAVRIYD